MSCTVDASVFVAGARSTEPNYADSRAFLHQLHADAVRVVCPTLVIPESAAAIARRTGDLALADEVVDLAVSLAGVHMIVLDLVLARRAAELAKLHRLRGADSVYTAVAEAAKTTLVTWDLEMLRRAPAAVPTMTPSDWLAAHARPEPGKES